MAIIYCGDLHGRVNDLIDIIQLAEAKQVVAIIQVGDFGLGFPNDSWEEFFKIRAQQDKWKVPIYTCLGNHDNWDRLDQLNQEQGYPDKVEVFPGGGLYFVPRGNVLDIDGISHIFIGGAESTDQERRTPGKTWWSREQPEEKEFEKFRINLEEQKPDTVVAHEVPLRVNLYRARRNQSYTPNMMEQILKASSHQPKRFYFGHHHLLEKWTIKKTKYYCCGLHGQYWLREI